MHGKSLVCRMKTTDGRTHDCERNGWSGLPRHGVVFTRWHEDLYRLAGKGTGADEEATMLKMLPKTTVEGGAEGSPLHDRSGCK